MLLQKNARLDCCNAAGSTALHLAASSGSHEICKIIVDTAAASGQSNVDLFVEDNEGI
jgi:ankyrin repeat protein